MHPPFPAYDGNDAYVFVCYAHDDAEFVYPELTRLQDNGVNIWYDEGISPGELFSDELADRIGGCTTFLYFVSPRSVASRFCLNEVNYAASHDKRVVALHLEPTELPSGLELTIGLAQAVMRQAMSDADFHRKLLDAVTVASDSGPRFVAPARKRGEAWRYLTPLLLVVAAATWWAIRPDEPSGGGASVAVLPFANVSGDPDDLYISDGLADELRDRLARTAGLRVAARRSSIAFRDQVEDVTEIAEQLGVQMLLEGQLRRDGNDLRISVQLIDGAGGFQIWSQNFQSGVDELVALHPEIANRAVEQIMPEAVLEAPARSSGSRSAHDLMLLARHFEHQVRDSQRVDETALARAIELYQKAAEFDPESAQAHSRLAAALLYRGNLDEAEKSILRAVDLDENSSDVQYALGLYHWATGSDGSGEAFARAIELNPNHADAAAARALWFMHHLEFRPADTTKAVDLFRRALQLDPMSLIRYEQLGNYSGLTGNSADVREVAESVEARFDDYDSLLLLARLYELVGELDVAVAWALRARAKRPDIQDAAWKVAALLARMGEYEAANALDPDSVVQLFLQRRYDELVDVAQLRLIDEPNDVQLWYLLAFAYNATRQFPLSVRLLEIMGMPDTVTGPNRRNDAVQAMTLTYLPALAQTGNDDRANELAEWVLTYMDMVFAKTWWPETLRACALGIVGKSEEALVALERIDERAESTELAWYPLLKDAVCFLPLANNPRYRAVIATMEARQLALRERLPETLAAYGVSL